MANIKKEYDLIGDINADALYKSLDYDLIRREIKGVLPPNQGFTIEETIGSILKEKGRGRAKIHYKIVLTNDGKGKEEDFKKIQSKLEEVLKGKLIEIK